MKSDIHPKYYPAAKVVCACGNEFAVGATVPEIHVEICSACHPFYTGKDKLIDTEGRVEKFTKRQATAATAGKENKVKSDAKKTREDSLKKPQAPRSLRELMKEANK